MSRSNIPEDERQDFALYVDEFQNFSTESFATIMSEARKYHLNLIVANQFTTQLTDEIRDAVFGNMGTIVSFRIGQNDVEALSRYFQPSFDGDDLLRVPNHNAVVRTLVGGVPTQPFSMATLPPLGNPNPGLSKALKQLSAAKYGKPRAVVEKAIFERLATKEQTPQPFQNPFGPATASAPRPSFAAPSSAPSFASPAPAPTPTGPSGSGSFLDEWLAKQRASAPVAVVSPARTQLPPPPAPSAPVQPTPLVPIPSAPSAPQPVESTVVSTDEVSLGSVAPVSAPVSLEAQPGPQAASTEPVTEPGNISSAQLDQEEIDEIAEELKKDLKPVEAQPPEVEPGDAPELEVDAKTAPLPVAPAPAPEPEPEAPKHGILQAKKPGEQAEPAPDDTIFIDNEGKLHLRDEETESKQGA